MDDSRPRPRGRGREGLERRDVQVVEERSTSRSGWVSVVDGIATDAFRAGIWTACLAGEIISTVTGRSIGGRGKRMEWR